MRTLKSEMQLTTEEFKGQANSVDALEAKGRILNDQITQQRDKVEALERALKEVGEVYKDQPKKIDEYQQSLNRAKTELIKMERELQENDRYLDEAKRSTDQAAKSIDGFGKSVEEATDGSGGRGGLNAFAEQLGDLKGMLVGGAFVAGLKGVADSITAIVEETEEYRRVMGQLEQSSQAAGYTTEQTAEAYNRLYGVLGDTQTAATTVANLQSIGLSQTALMVIVDQVTGAWAKYGDSIPIDGLAESINETIQAGQVTGTFADVLNWAGTSEDDFNKKLAEGETVADRANTVMKELAQQGLEEVADGYRINEEAAIKANEAQAKYEEAQANLAEKILPAKTWLTNLATTGWDVLTNSIQTAIDAWNDAKALFAKESELRKDGFFISQEERQAAYGYEKYYNEDGLLRYRQVESDLAGADTSVKPAATARDVFTASQAAANATLQATGRWDYDSFGATITLKTEDGRAFGQYMTEFVNEENAANPQARSDTFS